MGVRVRFGITLVPMIAILAGAWTAGPDDGDTTLTPRERRIILGMSPRPALPADPTNAVADDPRAARLGQTLFFDTGLSADGSVACGSCHDPSQRFTDGLQRGEGLAEVARHTMSILDVGYQRWLFWDGRADTLWAQALEPIEHPDEHGFTRVGVAQHVYREATLREMYEQVFGSLPALDDATRFPEAGRPVADDPAHEQDVAWRGMLEDDRRAVDVVFANVGKAIAAYERRLVSGDALFDEFVRGVREDDPAARAALDPAAQRGLKLFVGKANCRLCHSGPHFSDGEFHSTGIPPLDGDFPNDPARYTGVARVQSNPFNAAGEFSDQRDGPAAEKVRSLIRSPESWGQFKTPSLRGVAATAPYMHEGQVATLDLVVRHYSTLENAVLPGHHQEQLLVPLHLSEREIADLVAFLESLTPAMPDESLLEPMP